MKYKYRLPITVGRIEIKMIFFDMLLLMLYITFLYKNIFSSLSRVTKAIDLRVTETL